MLLVPLVHLGIALGILRLGIVAAQLPAGFAERRIAVTLRLDIAGVLRLARQV